MIAHALGIPETPGVQPLEALKRGIGELRLLLVLDNFEHLTPTAGIVAGLLRACPGVKLLVTSRAPLRIEGEQEFPVPPLSLPGPGTRSDPAALAECDSVRLFVQRARAVRPDFALTAENAGAVADLCTRLDGLPLAIELAAARTRLLPPDALLRRLAERLDVLEEGRRDRPDRHRTLLHAIGWSHDLLDPPARLLFRELSVFSGGFTLDAAESVCTAGASTIPLVESLLEHNLLQRRDGDGEPRFQLLETIRTYAAERLAQAGEEDAIRARHAGFVAGLVEELEPLLTGPRQARAYDRLAAEHDNVRSALRWAESRDPVVGLRICAAGWRLWVARGHLNQGREWVERFLARPAPPDESVLRARALMGGATIAHNQGENRRAREWLEEALALYRDAGDRQGVAATLNNLTWVASEVTDLERATELAEQALALCRELGDRRGEALALNNLGWVAMYRNDGPAARDRHAASLAIRRSIHDFRGMGFALTNLAISETMCGRPDEAVVLLDEAERILQPLRDPILLCHAMGARATAERARGDLDRAVHLLRLALGPAHEGGNPSSRASIRLELGEIYLLQGRRDEGLDLLRTALADWRAIGSPWGVGRAEAALRRAEEAGAAG